MILAFYGNLQFQFSDLIKNVVVFSFQTHLMCAYRHATCHVSQLIDAQENSMCMPRSNSVKYQ